MKEKLDFSGQLDDEVVVLLFRRYFLDCFKKLVIPLTIFILALILLVRWRPPLVYLAVIFVVLALGWASRQIIIWYYSFYLLTDQRLRFVNQRGLFSRAVIDIKLAEIDSVVFNTTGILANLLNFGKIIIDSRAGQLTINPVSCPEKVYDIIQKQMLKQRQERV